MISLEYINVHFQEGNKSYALKSHRQSGEPILIISRENGLVVWKLEGLKKGEEQTISKANPRKNRIDFYIGFEDLKKQRDLFPVSNGNSNGVAVSLTNSQGSQRPTGKKINMLQPIGRTKIENVFVEIPPYTLTKGNSAPIYFNVDAEYAYYLINNENKKLTDKEIHFGIQHNYNVSLSENADGTLVLQMDENKYKAILEFIDMAIEYYENLLAN